MEIFRMHRGPILAKDKILSCGIKFQPHPYQLNFSSGITLLYYIPPPQPDWRWNRTTKIVVSHKARDEFSPWTLVCANWKGHKVSYFCRVFGIPKPTESMCKPWQSVMKTLHSKCGTSSPIYESGCIAISLKFYSLMSRLVECTACSVVSILWTWVPARKLQVSLVDFRRCLPGHVFICLST